MKDFGSRDKNLYRVASSQHPVKCLGRTYTERHKPILGICSKSILYLLGGPLVAKQTIHMHCSHSWSGGPSMATKFAIDGLRGPVVAEDHLQHETFCNIYCLLLIMFGYNLHTYSIM